jgi:NAD(P)-dependent dehydrogenase (short-subunit alcohol dehydrogenase family)
LSSFDLAGRVVAVTGGSSGVGLSCARLATRSGASVVLLARDPDKLAKARATLGDAAWAIPTDLGDPAAVRAAFDQIADRHAKLDGLLNVAGYMAVQRVETASDAVIAHAVGTNFLGAVYTTRAAIPLLRAAGGGDIVNVSSEVTLDDLPLASLYSSTKAALESFSASMVGELRPDGIRVVLARIGHTDTPISGTLNAAAREEAVPLWRANGYMTRVAGGEAMDPDDVAECILYAISRPRSQMLDVIQIRAAR